MIDSSLTRGKCPLSVMILAFVYIAIGAVGFVYHFPDLHTVRLSQFDGIWIELVELLAVLIGVFLLRGRNWARWLALAWIALHVVLSVFDANRGLVVHVVLCVVIAWLLFRRVAARYFNEQIKFQT